MRLLYIFFLFILITGANFTYASDLVIQLDDTHEYQHLSGHILYIEDQGATLTFDDVKSLANDQWQTFEKAHSDPNFGFTDSSYWLKLSIRNNTELKKWIIESSYSLLDDLRVYMVFSDGRFDEYTVGDRLVFHERPIPHRNFLFDIPLAENTEVTIYIRAQSSSAIQLPISIWPKHYYFYKDNFHIVTEGLYFGAMLMMAAFNIFILFMVLDKTYLYYVLFVVFQALFQAEMQGYGFQFLWSNATWIQHYSVIWLLNGLIGFVLLFWDGFLDLPQNARSASFLLRSFAMTLLTLCLGSLFLPYSFVIKASIIVGAISVLFALIIAIPLFLVKKVRSAKLFLIAWSTAILGGVIFALNKWGVIPYSVYSEYALQVGTLIEVVLLSVAISDRISQAKREKLQAKYHAVSLQKEYNEQLEQRVEQRKEELEQVNQQLAEISKTDPLTSLANRRYFNEIFNEEFKVSVKNNTPYSIILIDIDHFKAINDNYGHPAGDECIRLVAGVLKEVVKRESDMITRYGGEEFAITLPGVNLDQALTMAEQIRHSIAAKPVCIEGEIITVRASLGVACSLTSSQQIKDSMMLVNLADEALYKSKQDGRNCVNYIGFA